jgi:hypothetical protein
MSERTPYPKYQDCPCGSGQKYKFCCFTKGFHYYVDDKDDEKVSREIPLSPELHELLVQRKAEMEKKLGRPVRPDDLIFPELAALSEEQFMTQATADMRQVGIPPALIYAYEKTGLMVTETNQHLIPDVDLAAWEAAIEEYYAAHPEDDLRTT